MRKNKTMRLASGLLVAVLLTTSIISGILAKYTSSATGSDTAMAAKWSFLVNDTDIADHESFDIDLFSTVLDSDGETTEDDVAVGEDAALIAPGTSGSFEISLENASEVTADYSLILSAAYENGNKVPLLFSVDGMSVEGEPGDDFSLFALDDMSGDWFDIENGITWDNGDTPMGIGETKTVTVYWIWPYDVDEETDEADTEAGMAGDSITVSATITATQHD